MKSRASNKILSLLLTAALLLCGVFAPPVTAYAAEVEIGAGTNGFQSPVDKSGDPSTYQTIYYGTNSENSDTPIAWRVLNVSGGEVFLQAQNSTGDNATANNNWKYGQGTNPRDWLTNDNGLPSGFTDAELAAISKQKVLDGTTVLETTVADDSGDPFFLLSVKEAENTSYFPAGDEDRKSGGSCWLRSPSTNNDYAAFTQEGTTGDVSDANGGGISTYIDGDGSDEGEGDGSDAGEGDGPDAGEGDGSDEGEGDGDGTGNDGGVTITIEQDAQGDTALRLSLGVSITDADLLVGVSAEDENGEAVDVTVSNADGLDYDDPQPKGGPDDPQPYIITYAAGDATATRECFVAHPIFITRLKTLEPDAAFIDIPLPAEGESPVTLEDIPFPAELEAYDGEEGDPDSNTYQVPVDKWVCVSCEDDCDFTVLGTHTFKPEFIPSEYAIGEGVETPEITVNVVASIMLFGATQTANTFEGLQTAIASFNAGTDDMEITVGADFDLTGLLSISNANGKTLTITSADGSTFTLTRGITGNLFTVENGTGLILKHIIIDGNKTAAEYQTNEVSSLVYVKGALTMQDGAILQNNIFGSKGGGVYVSGGTFNMEGGAEISGNAVSSLYTSSGGGVYMSDGTFTMSGDAEINGNTASYEGGGVYMSDGTFTMSGDAEISGNAASSGGGGIYVNSGTFAMSDGTVIRRNTSSEYKGGGVYMSDGTFTMSGGLIVNNTAYSSGCGVFVYNGVLTMSGDAEISGNSASYPHSLGGGAHVVSGTFTMDGGLISNNTADYGGGVCVNSNGTFNISGSAKIIGNRALSSGGVFMFGGTFTMSGNAEISENTASYEGGGVYMLDGAAFTMGGGLIDNNTADYGGGMYMYEGTFTMNGGLITNNKAKYGGGLYIENLDNSENITFTMTDGEICNNTASSSGGGVYYNGRRLTLGGTSKIINNITGEGESAAENNIYLLSGTAITIGTEENTPQAGMCAGISMADPGTFVGSGATAVIRDYFYADSESRYVSYADSKLSLTDGRLVTLTVKKDGGAWTDHGKAFYLKSGSVLHNGRPQSGGIYKISLPLGVTALDLYDGTTDTGIDITVNTATIDYTLDYYTVQFTAEDHPHGTSGGSTVSATYGIGAINSGTVVLGGSELAITVTGAGASRYDYLWSGTGTNSQTGKTLTISSLNSPVDATCTVTGITYSIDVRAEGLDSLKVGQAVSSAKIIFTLRGSEYADTINPADFAISGLPGALTAGTAVRASATAVEIPITGVPTAFSATPQTLSYSASIPAANIRDTEIDIPVTGTITVTMLPSDATLSALTVSSGTLEPAFNPATTSYAATVANNVSSVTVTATASDANATVSGAGVKTLIVGENIISITVTAQDGTTKTYTIIITRESSGNNGGGSGGGSSSGRDRDRGGSGTTTSTTTTPPPTTSWLEENPAGNLASGANSNHQDYVRTRSTGAYGVRAAAWAKLAGLRYQHDTITDGAVQIRLYIDTPESITKDLMVSGYVKGSDVERTSGHFGKWFKNTIRVIHLDQQADWSQPVKIAARIDLTGMYTANLYFYSYDKKTNTYKRIEKPMYWIDKNGYLHFTTEYAGNIIVSEWLLERR